MIYILLADGFEEMEALCPYDVLKRGNADVRFVSITDTLSVQGSHGVVFKADMTYRDIPEGTIEMTVLPGGMPGMKNLHSFAKTDDILQRSKYLAAICASPSVLGLRGYLKGKKATCYPGFEKNLLGAELSPERVVTDGNVTTSIGAGAAVEFGLRLLSVLKGEEISNGVRASMQ